MLGEAELDSAGLTMLEDCCRTLDIVDRLSGALKSKNQEWMRLAEQAEQVAMEAGAGQYTSVYRIELVINPILGEIRQQRLAVKQLLAQLKLGNATPKTQESEHKSLFDRLEQEFID